MVRMLKNCLQLSLKLFNSIIGMVGIAMIMYGLWLLRVWQSDMEGSSSDDQTSFPWFIHAFIGLGISFCAITCLGHFAAHTAHAHFLSCYIPVMSLLLVLETAFMADVFLNSDWEEDLPEDPTGRLDDFIDFVESNMELCKWFGVLILLAQGVCILLATLIRNLRTDARTYYYSATDSAPPLLNTSVQQLPYVIGDPYFAFPKYP